MRRILFLSLVLTVAALPAGAHGTSLSLSHTQVQPGQQIEVKGTGVGENAAVEITLEGALNTYRLGSAQGNAHGEFQLEVVIPAEVKPGSYTVKGQAGTAVASAPLRVAPQAPGTSEAESVGEERNQAPASLEPLSLDRSRGAGETVTVWGLILLAVFAGGLLWFKD
ncbi:MAG: hypothetical protein ACE5IP_12435 [Terriglobia bacterium]